MVRNPICAAGWQPISFVRQSMLKNSFSYLPVLVTEKGQPTWMLVSDLAIACYLQTATNADNLRERLTQRLEEVTAHVKLSKSTQCKPGDLIVDVLKNWDGLPVLILSQHSGELAGIRPPFDLL